MFSQGLTEYVPKRIWLKDYPIRFAGCRFNARMAIIRLSDGRLLIHSPCPIDIATKAEIDSLGSVAAIIAPGDYHHLNVRSARNAFVDAEIHICPGIDKKDPSLPYTKVLSDEPDPIWAADLDQVLIRGSRFIREVAFFHRESATLILVDSIENFSDSTTGVGGLLKFYWKLVFKMWDRPKPAPEYQMGWVDKAAARESLGRILDWDFENIILAHGDLVDEDAQQLARSAWQTVMEDPSVNGWLGHYTPRKAELLKDLDRSLALMNDTLVHTHGEDDARQMQASVRAEYEALIPEIPYAGLRARMLNFFLLVTAQEVAAYRGLRKFGKSPAEIWEYCHEALRLRTAAVAPWKLWILKNLMFSGAMKRVMARRARRHQVDRIGGFEIEYLSSESGEFDLGINYRRCGNYRLAMDHDAEEFAPYICLSDIALSEAFGWGLTRTRTLADGCDHCDFRMKKDAATRITSTKPEVQRTIDRINARELTGP
jgi:hypothetical protein